jgi:hypothetical protein
MKTWMKRKALILMKKKASMRPTKKTHPQAHWAEKKNSETLTP